MGDRDRPNGRPDVGLGGDGLDGPVNAGLAYGVDTLVLRLKGMPSPPRPATGRMARLRPKGNPR